MRNPAKIFLLTLHSFVFLMATPLMAEEHPKAAAPAPATAPVAAPAPQAPKAPSLISCNGFSCSSSGSLVDCQGKFQEVDKNVVFGARGTGELTLRVKKDDEVYTYASANGCLCEEGKKEISCQNAQGAKNK